MIGLTIVPYVLARDIETEKVKPYPSCTISTKYFTYDSETSSGFDLLEFDYSVSTTFLDTRNPRDLAYCYLVIADNGFTGVVRPYLINDLACGLVGTYFDLGAYVWDYNFEDK